MPTGGDKGWIHNRQWSRKEEEAAAEMLRVEAPGSTWRDLCSLAAALLPLCFCACNRSPCPHLSRIK